MGNKGQRGPGGATSPGKQRNPLLTENTASLQPSLLLTAALARHYPVAGPVVPALGSYKRGWRGWGGSQLYDLRPKVLKPKTTQNPIGIGSRECVASSS
jgi:hypothetical protein